jgi:hypothetical protein
MDIIIGREVGLRRLHCIAGNRTFDLGAEGCVPMSVSKQHCKITINGSTLTIENLKPQNSTYVDGNQVAKKTITAASRVQLGEERFLLPLQNILQLATGGNPVAPGAQTFSLTPLRSVWEEYNNEMLAIQNKAAKEANKQRLQGIFSMLGMCIGVIPIPGVDPTLCTIIRISVIVAALALAIYFFVKGSKGAVVQQQLNQLDLKYTEKYKCPNPNCGKPFGRVPYFNIKYNKQCFACGCKYTHDED